MLISLKCAWIWEVASIGTEYRNAVTQTREPWPPEKKPITYPLMFSRETQLSFLRIRVNQTYREAFTQMDKNPTYWSLDKNGVVISNTFDYWKIPGPYEDSDAWMRKRIAAAIIIQKNTRRKIAQRTAKRMRQYIKDKAEFWKEQDVIQKQISEERLQYEINRRLQPETEEDFDILYKELAAWQLAEYNKIPLDGEARLKALKLLIAKQFKLIQTLDGLRGKAAHINRRKMVTRKLTTMALPKVWELSNGQILHVTTPATTRAGDLGQLYLELEKKVDSMDDRMAILGYVKWTVQVFDTALTRELLNLIQREADLMYRGRSAKSISGLRQRILHRFYRFVEDPQYNPEAQQFANVATDFDYGNKHFHFMRDAPYREKLLPPTKADQKWL
ncbi:hypothetical protein KC19_6G098100 [Ceratodon purpureus]|uniref:IQ motif and ubiquitin-like domain-containing protein n=1 Tax=Ceratodon purpureus TaxID=3225 RepID=A0A8T0HH79_CERPU|nr:hypothetical protein KC19_6G098100 [Ceratodon purpureus]